MAMTRDHEQADVINTRALKLRPGPGRWTENQDLEEKPRRFQGCRAHVRRQMLATDEADGAT